MPDQGGEKTEKASPKKKQDERKKGNVFMSKDITTIVSMVVAFYAFSYFISSFLEQLQLIFEKQIYRAQTMETIDTAEIMGMGREFLLAFGSTLLPAMILIGLSAFFAVALQTRFLVSTESLKFKLERIDPIKGFKRLFSLRSLVELLKSIIKIVVLTCILYNNIKKTVQLLPSMVDWDLIQGMGYAGQEILSLVLATAIAFGAVALGDYLYQWYEYEKNLRMTKQEVKDEYKNTEGNPEIKSARRQKQREIAQQRMMQQVQQADVVVRNPTHYAVALKYKLNEDIAPVVLAKGKDNIALKIVEEAEKHHITTVENKPLARGLYEAAQLDQMIPAEFFQPVAELLAWLYSANRAAAPKITGYAPQEAQQPDADADQQSDE